jgi:hypothetical protein
MKNQFFVKVNHKIFSKMFVWVVQFELDGLQNGMQITLRTAKVVHHLLHC